MALFPVTEQSAMSPRPRRRALVILNRNAGGVGALDPIIDGLRAAGLAIETLEMSSPEALARAVRRHRDRVDVVVVVGGDGTIRAVAPALVETDTPLALVPCGTANDFARGLQVPAVIEEACDLAARGPVRTVDAAVCDGGWFVNDASVGLAVETVRSADSTTKKRLGRLGYAAAMASALRRVDPFQVRLTCDGRRHELPALQVTIGNGRFFGGGLVIGPEAALDDGMLDACVIHPAPWWRLVGLIPALHAGRTPAGVTVIRGQRIRVETDRPMAVTTDGDVTARTPVTLSVRPGALRVVC